MRGARDQVPGYLELVGDATPLEVAAGGDLGVAATVRYAGPGRLRAGAFAAEVVVVRDGVVVASTAPSPDAWFASLDVGHGLTVDLSRTVPAVEWCAGGASEPGPFPALAPGSYQVVPVVRVVAPRVVLAGVDAAETGEDVVLVGQPVDLTVR